MSKQSSLVVGFSLLFLAILACARGPAVQSAATEPPAGQSRHELNYDGRKRSYLLYTPASVDWSQPVPVVLVFHGGGGNAENALRMSGFNEVADQNGFLVVYPNGSRRGQKEKLLTWNGGSCCGYAQEINSDDVGFVRAIIADLGTDMNIDSNRIYAAGMSNGGIMSHRLACEAADLLAAVAPVAGTLNVSPCSPSAPVAVIEFHGTQDQNILYDGGYGPNSVSRVDFASVADSIDFWVTANGCSPEPETEASDHIRHETWTGCQGSADVELYTIIGGGHSWPGDQAGWAGADPPDNSISASQLIWQFFEAHPKP